MVNSLYRLTYPVKCRDDEDFDWQSQYFEVTTLDTLKRPCNSAHLQGPKATCEL